MLTMAFSSQAFAELVELDGAVQGRGLCLEDLAGLAIAHVPVDVHCIRLEDALEAPRKEGARA